MKNFPLFTLVICLLFSCNSPETTQREAQEFIDNYTKTFLKHYSEVSNAQWSANTEIIAGDSINEVIAKRASEAIAKFTGSVEVITKAKNFLSKKQDLSDIQIKQLEKILYAAANNPQTVPELVNKRIAEETKQNSKLYGYQFMLDGDSIAPNDIDRMLNEEQDLAQRQKIWEASKAVGKELKSGLMELRKLRNATVQNLDYSNYFSYQVSDYGMETEEMMALNKKIVQDVWPLYRELHTYARYTLAEKYNTEVPQMLPAHWLSNRWGQDWSAMLQVEGADLDAALKDKSAAWIVEKGEEFYVSLGYDKLPKSFYTRSSLYPFPADSSVKKNTHASAWHLDLDKDVRSLMSVENTSEWWETVHHELGHVYYFMTYTNPEIPPLLREGANRAYHEAMGSLIGLASMQSPYLKGQQLLDESAQVDEIQALLKEALNYVVFLPFSAGTMTHFEKALYADKLEESKLNSKWWELVKTYQGIVPPNERGEEFCDAATKTHINDDPAQYYDYALSYVLLFQMHDHIANNILKQNPRATNYFGNQEVGNFLQEIMKTGCAKDWRQVLKETTGKELGAEAMLNYFEPLMQWLKTQNQERQHTLPEKI